MCFCWAVQLGSFQNEEIIQKDTPSLLDQHLNSLHSLGTSLEKNSSSDRHFSSERVVEGCTCRYIALIRKAREKTCLFLKLVILRSTQMINSSIGKCFSSMCSLLWCKVFLDLFRLMFWKLLQAYEAYQLLTALRKLLAKKAWMREG